MIRPSLRAAACSLLFTTVSAQSQLWELVTPIKDRSEICAITLLDNVNGYAIDRVEHNILVTHDGGQTWERRRQGLPDRLLSMWVWDMDHVLVGTENGDFYITDNGFVSYTPIETSYDDVNAVFFVDEQIGFAATQAGEILRTDDGGNTWTEQNSGTSSPILDIHFLNADKGFACTGASDLRYTEDGGTTWDSRPTAGLHVNDVDFYDDQMGVGAGYLGSVVRTVDGGSTWTAPTSPITAQLNHVEALAGGIAIASGVQGKLLRSTNYGSTWALVQVGTQPHYTSAFTPDGLGVSGTLGQMYRTTDQGASWQLVHTGTPNSRLNKVSFGNSDIGVTVGHAGIGGPATAFMRTVDGGAHWSGSGTYGGSGGIYAVHLNSAGAGASGGSSGYTTHTADNFATSQLGSAPIPSSVSAIHAFTPQHYIAAGGTMNSGLYHTLDGGASWDYTLMGPIYDLFFVDGSIGYGVGGNLVVKTDDGGVTWTELDAAVGGDLFTVHFVDALHGWIGGVPGGARTVDGGTTWDDMSVGYCVGIHFTDVDTGYAVQSSGQVKKSVDGGVTWEDMANTYITGAFLRDAALVGGNLISVGDGGDVYRMPVDCSVSASVPVITQVGGVLYAGPASGHQWYLDGEIIAGAEAAAFTPMQSGNYTVVLIDAIGCLSPPSAPFAVISTTVRETSEGHGIRIWPVPARSVLRIELPGRAAGVFEVLDMRGLVVMRGGTHQAIIDLDISGLATGAFVVRWVSDEVIHVGRFVKE